LRRALNDLPKDLDETYTRIILNISEENKADAIKLLQWLCYSLEPISLEMAVDILATEYSDSLGRCHFDPDQRPPEADDVLSICSSLVSLGESRTLQLAHFSVKEYLTSERVQLSLTSPDYSISSTNANLIIAGTCLAYIMDSSLNLITEDSKEKFPLSKYARFHWLEHYFAAGDAVVDSWAEALLMCFLTEDTHLKNYLSWLSVQHIGFKENELLSSIGDPVFFASLFGLIRILKILIHMGPMGNCLGGLSGIALQAGAMDLGQPKVRLCLETLKVLLEAGLTLMQWVDIMVLRYKQRHIQET
jgi:hypothetical protein